jgi:hypothetical protein
MRERPILFNGEMVRAILNGRKTQTRRIAKGVIDYDYEPDSETQESYDVQGYDLIREGENWIYIPPCKHKIGDHLWVRETWQAYHLVDYECDHWEELLSPKERHDYHCSPVYKADGKSAPDKWFPSIFLPREYSRLTLKITNIRVKLLQNISDGDCYDEGVEAWLENEKNLPLYNDGTPGKYKNIRSAFKAMWSLINGEESWESNPFVWVIEFERKP